MTKNLAAVFVTIFFLIKSVDGLAGMQTITFDIEGMG